MEQESKIRLSSGRVISGFTYLVACRNPDTDCLASHSGVP